MSAPSKQKYVLFLAHATEDRDLAEAVQILLRQSLGRVTGSKLVFRSTDPSAIDSGVDWRHKIITALREARICLALITPNSLYKPWLLYESGAADALYYGRQRSKRLVPLLAKGVLPSLVPSPLQRCQHRELSAERQINALLKDLANLLGTTLSPPDQGLIRNVLSLASPRGQHWESVESVLVARSSDPSPYNIESVLQLATKRIVLFGQNLQWVARTRRVHDAIIDFLKGGKDREMHIAICDYRKKGALHAWATVNTDLERIFPYEAQVRQSSVKFCDLQARCKKEKVSGFEFHVLPLIPFGATVMDPDNSDGVIALHPMVNFAEKSADRPQLLIRRQSNRELFAYYWSSLKRAWDYAPLAGRRPCR